MSQSCFPLTVCVLGLFFVPLGLVPVLCQADTKIELEVQETYWEKRLWKKKERDLDEVAGSLEQDACLTPVKERIEVRQSL